MSENLIAKAEITINKPISEVWKALLNPEMIKKYMFGTEVVTDWQEGSQIVWKGEWQGKPYEDKGVILKVEKEKLFQCTHFSPLSGVPDLPENYHTLTYELSSEGNNTHLVLTQDHNASEEEKKHSEGMWNSLLENIKKLLEA